MICNMWIRYVFNKLTLLVSSSSACLLSLVVENCPTKQSTSWSIFRLLLLTNYFGFFCPFKDIAFLCLVKHSFKIASNISHICHVNSETQPHYSMCRILEIFGVFVQKINHFTLSRENLSFAQARIWTLQDLWDKEQLYKLVKKVFRLIFVDNWRKE